MSVLPIGIGSSIGYNIDNSVRLRAAASAYLSRTFGTPTNNLKWTCSWWTKRGEITTRSPIGSSVAPSFITIFNASNQFEVIIAGTSYFVTSAVFRDPSAHMHLTLVFDSANAVQADRIILYVNGIRAATSTASCPLNQASGFNASSASSSIGRAYAGWYGDIRDYFDGLLSDVHFVDGQALTPSSFGEQNADGVWVPKPYTGTYGTNGFKLDFKDAAVTAGSNAGLGKDVSGNGNYWNTNNISVTSGVTYDALTDTPTNNYCTLNPLIYLPAGTIDYACLRYHRATTASFGTVGATFCLPTTGKWYWEVKPGLSVNSSSIGVADISGNPQYPATGTEIGHRSALDYSYRSDGHKWSNNTDGGAYGATFANTNVIGVAWDSDAGTLTFFKDDTSQGTAYSSISQAVGKFVPASSNAENGGYDEFNFGQRPFANTTAWATLVSSGFKTLCTANLPSVAITKPKAHFDVKTYAGNASSQSITGLAFQPSLVWLKSRGRAVDNALYDAVRGVEKRLESNNTDAEVTGDTTGLTAFNSDGWSMGALDQINGTTATNSFVGWAWKANGAGSSNTDGSITATVSANTVAGFSVITYTGTGANATIGHGLGVAPKMIIVKDRTAASANDWATYHAGVASDPQTDYLLLNSTAAAADLNTYWNDTAPTSSVFSVGTDNDVNQSGHTYVAYCFAEIPGYSKFGSYVGNGSTDGPFVYCGFRPRWILARTITTSSDWLLIDTARDTYNVCSGGLYVDLSNSESTATARLDVTAGGFKIRDSNALINNANTCIFAAFAEHPFGGSNVSPSPAR